MHLFLRKPTFLKSGFNPHNSVIFYPIWMILVSFDSERYLEFYGLKSSALAYLQGGNAKGGDAQIFKMLIKHPIKNTYFRRTPHRTSPSKAHETVRIDQPKRNRLVWAQPPDFGEKVGFRAIFWKRCKTGSPKISWNATFIRHINCENFVVLALSVSEICNCRFSCLSEHWTSPISTVYLKLQPNVPIVVLRNWWKLHRNLSVRSSAIRIWILGHLIRCVNIWESGVALNKLLKIPAENKH